MLVGTAPWRGPGPPCTAARQLSRLSFGVWSLTLGNRMPCQHDAHHVISARPCTDGEKQVPSRSIQLPPPPPRAGVSHSSQVRSGREGGCAHCRALLAHLRASEKSSRRCAASARLTHTLAFAASTACAPCQRSGPEPSYAPAAQQNTRKAACFPVTAAAAAAAACLYIARAMWQAGAAPWPAGGCRPGRRSGSGSSVPSPTSSPHDGSYPAANKRSDCARITAENPSWRCPSQADGPGGVHTTGAGATNCQRAIECEEHGMCCTYAPFESRL